MFLNTLKEKYGINLNEQQQQAVRHVNGPALVLAGPGSGKTTVITARTAFLIFDAGIDPESVLTLTFNKAAQLEMRNRFSRIYGAAAGSRVKFLTLHSFSNSVVGMYERMHGKRLTRIEGDEEGGISKRQILKSIYQQINGSNINDDELENLINEIGFVKNSMIKDFKDVSAVTRNFASVYRVYEDYKKSNLYIDFDDMLTYAYSILKKCPDMLSYYRNKYRYIQVDEGQDLSKIQFELLKLLVDRKNSNIFIVADDDQSIYGFRGADPGYILNISEEFDGCRVYYLEKNYRSTKNIVEISSKFIGNNNRRFAKKHETDNEYKNDPIIVYPKDEKEQLDFIVEKVRHHLKEGKSVAVLYRNNISSVVIADILNRNGINFMVRQNRLFFFNHWMIQDILAFLKFSLNQLDVESFSRICFRMNRYISKAMLEYVQNTEEKESVLDSILRSEDIQPYRQRAIIELKGEFRDLSVANPLKALKYIEHNFKYFDSVKQYCENTGLSFEYLYSLFGILKSLAERCSDIPQFLQRMNELRGMLEGENRADYGKSVTLSTIHSSKGLEYDAVIMADLTEKEIPGTKAAELAKKKNDLSMIEEERRLFYVGMTRAREYLYLVSPASRNGEIAESSSFIGEVIRIMNKKAAGEIAEGVVINHKRYGEGVVIRLTEKENGRIFLDVDFRGVRRKLDYFICLENGIISFNSDNN